MTTRTTLEGEGCGATEVGKGAEATTLAEEGGILGMGRDRKSVV